MIKIENLHVEVDGNKILNGINLEVKAGETHAWIVLFEKTLSLP